MTQKALAKKNSYKRGLRAESLSVLFLRLKGYQILARRAKTPVGEIDVIAKRGKTLVAIEVKARKTLELGAYSVSTIQQRRISKAIEYWLQQNLKYAALDIRFDVILMATGHFPKHISNAW